MTKEEINKSFKEHIEAGKILHYETDGQPWWYIGIVREKKTKKPIAWCAYYEPTDGITAGLVGKSSKDALNLPASFGVDVASKMFSILLEGKGSNKYEFERPKFYVTVK